MNQYYIIKALNLAMAYAGKLNCDLIVANDPDADRLAVSVKHGEGWYNFTGNEIGVLLGHWQIEQFLNKQQSKRAAVLASVVSSRMLKKIATVENIEYYDTLTGKIFINYEF